MQVSSSRRDCYLFVTVVGLESTELGVLRLVTLNTALSLNNNTFCRGLCKLEGQAIKGSSVTLQEEQRTIKGRWFL